jgi:two-component system chemotaxis response regulator CheB
MAAKIRVLIVDDSAFSRQSIKGMLESDDAIEVVGIASNGLEAMAKVVKLKPDIITLDFEMPEMDGFSFLRWVMKERPLPVIMISSFADSKTVFKALELGAADFVAKPTQRASSELLRIRDDLLEKVRGARDLRLDRLTAPVSSAADALECPDAADGAGQLGVVAVGASTGGPAALQSILTRLPEGFPAAMLISQHMPRGFTEQFAERLNRLSRIRVREAADGMPIERGTALICPGGRHLTVVADDRGWTVALRRPSPEDKYTPSVDVMLSSVAEQFGPSALAVILTGMGSDGKSGIVEIKGRGGYTIAESEETAVVFGMPQEAIKTGSVDAVLSLDLIPREIVLLATGKKGKWKKTRL